MKVSEMNSHQRALYYIMDELTRDLIGGNENTMQDYPEDSEEYQEAQRFLSMGHEAMKEFFFDLVRMERDAQKALRFAGNDFLLERIERRLVKWGY